MLSFWVLASCRFVGWCDVLEEPYIFIFKFYWITSEQTMAAAARRQPPHLLPQLCWPCKNEVILTYSVVQSHSWEANWFAASQEIPRISRNPKVHYRTHKRPPPVPILGQPNPVHIPTSHLLEIHPNIIHPSMPRSPQWFLSLRFPQQDPIHPLSSPIRSTCPAHLILLDFITRTILGEVYRSFRKWVHNFI